MALFTLPHETVTESVVAVACTFLGISGGAIVVLTEYTGEYALVPASFLART